MKSIYRLFLNTGTMALAVIVLSATTFTGRSQEFKTNRVVLTVFAQHLLHEKYDLRLGFYASSMALDTAKRQGSVLIIPDGLFEHAKAITTNDCITVGAALDKYATRVRLHYYQTRVIQKNAILQTPIGAGADWATKKAVLDIKLEGGDVVIVTRIE